MEKEFLPREESLKLKELGFKEPCIGRYYSKDKNIPIFMQWTKAQDFNSVLLTAPYSMGDINDKLSPFISAPLYQQAFRFFREKYKLLSFVDIDSSYRIYCDDIKFDLDIDSRIFKTHEDAELECLKKLIEIAKEQNVK